MKSKSMAAPRLITPEGEIIELSLEAYQKIQELLGENQQDTQRQPRAGHIDLTFGKYAGKSSLTEALIRERREELMREENDDRRIAKTILKKLQAGPEKSGALDWEKIHKEW